MSFSDWLQHPKPAQVLLVGSRDFTKRTLGVLLGETIQALTTRFGQLAFHGTIVGIWSWNLNSIFHHHPMTNDLYWGASCLAVGTGCQFFHLLKVAKDLDFSNFSQHSYKRRTFEALKEGDLQTLNEINQTHPDWNWKGYDAFGMRDFKQSSFTPLQKILDYASGQNGDTVEWLLDHGATLNVPPQNYYQTLASGKYKPNSLRERWFKKTHEQTLKSWNHGAKYLHAEAFDKLLEVASKDLSFSPVAVLDAFICRSWSDSSLDWQGQLLASFEKAQKFLPIETLQEAFETIQIIHPNSALFQQTRILHDAINSRIEQHTLQNNLASAQNLAPAQNKRVATTPKVRRL